MAVAGWRLRGSAELVDFGRLPGSGVGRGASVGASSADSSFEAVEYLAIRLRLQDWDVGLAGGQRRTGAHAVDMTEVVS